MNIIPDSKASLAESLFKNILKLGLFALGCWLFVATAAVLLLVLFYIDIFDAKYPKRLPVNESSHYLNKTFITKQPLVYLKNLPHYKDNVSEGYRGNGPMILADEASNKIVELRELSSRSKEWFLSTFRAEYIPIGTQFTVVGEFLHHHHRGIFGIRNFNSHKLLIKDKKGNISEISELSFELDIESKGYEYQFSKIDTDFLNNLEFLEKEKALSVAYKSHPRSVISLQFDKTKIEEFISFFELNEEISISTPSNFCELYWKTEGSKPGAEVFGSRFFINWGGKSCEAYFDDVNKPLFFGNKLTFKSKEAFVTTFLFVDAWSIFPEKFQNILKHTRIYDNDSAKDTFQDYSIYEIDKNKNRKL